MSSRPPPAVLKFVMLGRVVSLVVFTIEATIALVVLGFLSIIVSRWGDLHNAQAEKED